MRNIGYMLTILVVLMLSACGAFNVEVRSPNESTGTTSTAASQPEARTVEVNAPPVTTPEINPPEANAPPVTTPESNTPVISTPETANPTVEAPAGTTPEVARPTVTEGGATQDVDTIFASLLAEHGADFSECGLTITDAEACPKPESLGETELKQNINIQLILDSSGSMAEQIGGETKMDIAKRTLNQFVDTLPDDANVGLRVYGHTGSNQEQDRALSCQGTELFYPFAPLDKATFTNAINAFEPRGWTPIATALQAAQQDFATFDGATNTNIIYLVSDGIETCDGDPVAAARALKESNIQAVVNVIGFGVDAAAQQQLRAAAEAGGGQYFDARSASELERVFTEDFDWAAWTAYRLCIITRGTAADISNTVDITEFNLCITTRLTSENIQMTSALNADSGNQDIRSELFQRLEERHNSIRAEAERITTEASDQTEQQQQEREQLLATPAAP